MGKPAARVGDMHTCPLATPGTPPIPHVGGPILPAGVPTVLIGGLPAAVVGDMCVCVGQPDSIVVGSTGVFIGGRPAARMGDLTAHGGAISVGLPTVLIGEIGPMGLAMAISIENPCAILQKLKHLPINDEEKKEQVELQKKLEKAFAQNLKNVPEEKRMEAFNTLQHYNNTSHAADLAKLSEAVYGGPTPPGFQKIEGAALKQEFGLDDRYLNDEVSGFKSAIYKSTTGSEPEYVVAFGGTDGFDKPDILSDVKQSVGMKDEQYDRALIVGKTVRTKVGPQGFETAGHSLGGGLASAVSATTGAAGSTFNAAGLHPNTTRRENGVSDETRAANEKNVNAYFNSHDPLNRTQDNRGKVLFGLGWLASKIAGPLGAGGVGILAAKGALPDAYGNRIEVPSEKKGLLEHGIGDLIELLDKQVLEDLEKMQEIFGCS